MTDDEILAVVKAHKEGKQIEQSTVLGCWTATYGNPCWNFDQFDYRVKPEPRKPREWILHIPKDGRMCGSSVLDGHIYPGDSVGHNIGPVADEECVRVREVIE